MAVLEIHDKRPPEYHVWKALRARCYNPKNPRFEDYGGRGIKVCDRWRHDFSAFLADMGRRPPGCSIERKNNDLGYDPDNCRWATSAEQMINRRNTRMVDYHGEIIPLATLTKRFKIPANTLRARVLANWDIDEALSMPVRPKAPNNSRR